MISIACILAGGNGSEMWLASRAGESLIQLILSKANFYGFAFLRRISRGLSDFKRVLLSRTCLLMGQIKMSDRPQRIISRDLSGRPTRSWKNFSVTTLSLSLSLSVCVCVCVALAGRNISYNALYRRV